MSAPAPASQQAWTCVVADDHPPLLRAIAELVRGWGFTVVATTNSGKTAIEKIRQLRPQVAVVDLRLPHVSGVEIARTVAATTAVVIYTGYGDGALVREALDAGARGLVLKDAPLEDLRRALETIVEGGTYIDPVVAGAISTAADAGDELTPRERDVLRLLADGCAGAEIGRRLFISPETVRTHVGKAMQKLGASTRTEAVATALRRGFVA